MNLLIGLGWKVNKDIFEEDIDIDLCAFQLNKDRKVNSEGDFIFFNNPVNESSSVRFTGDNKIGSAGSSLDNEIIEIKTDNIPDYVDRIIITASIYEAKKRKQNFAMALHAYVRVINQANNDEIIRYDLSEDFSYAKSILIGELIREKENTFKFEPLGTSFEGELDDLCEKYGLYVEN